MKQPAHERAVRGFGSSPTAVPRTTNIFPNDAFITQKPVFKRSNWLGFDDPRFIGYENVGAQGTPTSLVVPISTLFTILILVFPHKLSSILAIPIILLRQVVHTMAVAQQAPARVHSQQTALVVMLSMRAGINCLKEG
jgi:hypothetical protein